MKNHAPHLLAALLLAATAGLPAHALETVQDIQQARTLTDAAMTAIGQGRIDAAMQQLQPYWLIPDGGFAAFVRKAVADLPATGHVFGRPTGWEFVRASQATDALMRFDYLQRFQHSAAWWQITLYRGTPGWSILSVHYKTDVQPLFTTTDCAAAVPAGSTGNQSPTPSTPATIAQARDLVDAVMAAIGDGDNERAIQRLGAFGGNMSGYQSLIGKWRADSIPILQGAPRSRGIQRVREQRIARSLVRFIYLQAFASDAVVWDATLFRRDDGWHVVNLAYSTEKDLLFEPCRPQVGASVPTGGRDNP